MEARTKYKLPTHGELKHIDIDLDKLQAATDKLAAEYVDVKTANKMLCDNHMALSKSVYDNFMQINLTEFGGDEELKYTLQFFFKKQNSSRHIAGIKFQRFLAVTIEVQLSTGGTIFNLLRR